jgi:hypothetical protein
MEKSEPIQLTQGQRCMVERQRAMAERRVLFEQALLQLKSLAESLKLPRPTCCLSYAGGNESDPRVEPWVAQFDEDLRKAGLTVLRGPGSETTADRILVVGTPLYLREYENRLSENGSGVATDQDPIARRMQGTEEEKASVVPLLLSGNECRSLPPALRGRVYADFRDENTYFSTAFDLMVHLYGLDVAHPGVAQWRRSLHGEELFGREMVEDDPELDPKQLQEALVEVGRTAREKAFAAGQPVVLLKEGRLVWVYADGTERAVEPAQSGTSGSEGR